MGETGRDRRRRAGACRRRRCRRLRTTPACMRRGTRTATATATARPTICWTPNGYSLRGAERNASNPAASKNLVQPLIARQACARRRRGLDFSLMTGLLVRVGVDSSNQDFGNWNAPVNPDLSFVYVPIPEWYKQREGMETPYTAVELALRAAEKPLPSHLRHRNMHLSPDFECLTYGDYDEGPGCRGRCLGRLKEGDFVVFYASFSPTGRIANSTDSKFYALIGQMFVKEVVPYGKVTQDRYNENAKTRCREYRNRKSCFILRADRRRSGRYSRCIHFAHWRNGAYRVFPELLDRWGNILKLDGVPVADGWVQRPSWLPSFGNSNGFLKWLDEQESGGLHHSNWDTSPENSWRVPIPVQTQEPPYGTSAVLTTTCATTEALV